MSKVIAVILQKGGVAKTTTSCNLGIGLAANGKRTLLIDFDPQGSLTTSLGAGEPDELPVTIADLMQDVINESETNDRYRAVIHHPEGVDYIPANTNLAVLEQMFVNVLRCEEILKQVVDQFRPEYDYIIIDSGPTLGKLQINVLAAADFVVIPVTAAYLPVKGLQQLMNSIGIVRRRLNRNLKIGGILVTMYDGRTNYAKDIFQTIREVYGPHMKIFQAVIPMSVKIAEASAYGRSIFKHAASSKGAKAYAQFAEEIIRMEQESEDGN